MFDCGFAVGFDAVLFGSAAGDMVENAESLALCRVFQVLGGDKGARGILNLQDLLRAHNGELDFFSGRSCATVSLPVFVLGLRLGDIVPHLASFCLDGGT